MPDVDILPPQSNTMNRAQKVKYIVLPFLGSSTRMLKLKTWKKRVRTYRNRNKKEPEEEQRKKEKEEALYRRWNDGIEAGFKATPEIRFPVIIEADTAVSSPEQLKAILNLPSVPESLTTKTTSLKLPATDTADEEAGEEKVICDVSWEQIEFLRQQWHSEEIVVWFDKTRRFALRVLSVKSEGEIGQSENEQAFKEVSGAFEPGDGRIEWLYSSQ
ncbi:hypothetical protein GGR51DRAFT_505282 [Nemania sp. FL0031]|nr:hypothetical protein GGR51DRAFT_505282 [Nemania sp. FL0031]